MVQKHHFRSSTAIHPRKFGKTKDFIPHWKNQSSETQKKIKTPLFPAFHMEKTAASLKIDAILFRTTEKTAITASNTDRDLDHRKKRPDFQKKPPDLNVYILNLGKRTDFRRKRI